MCCFLTAPRCTPSFPPPFCIIHPWRNEVLAQLDVITGRGSPGVQARVQIDGQLDELTALVDENGWWSVALPEPLLPGEHIIRAEQSVGRGVDTFSVPFVIEQPPLPTPIILEPLGGAAIPAGDVEVLGAGTPGNTITLCLNGLDCRSALVGLDGRFSTTFTAVAPGGRTVSATEVSPLTGQHSLTATVAFTAILVV